MHQHQTDAPATTSTTDPRETLADFVTARCVTIDDALAVLSDPELPEPLTVALISRDWREGRDLFDVVREVVSSRGIETRAVHRAQAAQRIVFANGSRMLLVPASARDHHRGWRYDAVIASVMVPAEVIPCMLTSRWPTA